MYLISVCATAAPGCFRAERPLEERAIAVVSGEAVVHALGERIAGLEGPSALRPGEAGSFTITYRNLMSGTRPVTLTLEVADGRCAVVSSQQAPVVAPARGEVTAAFDWTPGDADSDGHLVRAWAN